ncbi:MAG: flagellar filament capping protein FliD [Hungatella sp.]|nr:flagellar filament capping protein FliD [Hungatella sp.]
MASISSTNSTSSLGNTSLRGFGGMASGIDRDSIIEQMTLGTTTKINNQKKKISQLQWKQEAYMNISDKIIDLTDKYASYSSSSNLKDPTAFAKNVISVLGKESSTSFVTAKGTSSLINNVSILGVGQLATSTVQRSQTHISKTGLSTTVSDLGELSYSSKLAGLKLSFGVYDSTSHKMQDKGSFEFKSTYKTMEDDENGGKKEVTHTINYTPQTEAEYKKLVDDLNGLANEDGEDNALVKFTLEKDADGNHLIKVHAGKAAEKEGYAIKTSSSALTALGYEAKEGVDTSQGIKFSDFTSSQTKAFEESGIHQQSKIDYLTGKKLYFNYDGNQKQIELITSAERDAVKELTVKDLSTEEQQKLKDALTAAGEISPGGALDESQKLTDVYESLNKKLAELEEKKETDPTAADAIEKVKAGMGAISAKQMDKLKTESKLQDRLDKAFGKDMVKANFDGNISFSVTKKGSTLSAVTSDYNLLKELGISYGESNKINLGGKITQGALTEALNGVKITDANGQLDLKINGVQITGLTKDSTINDILSKINSSSAGVKATYVDATGEFMLISSETGEGRDISFDSDLAKALFDGGKDKLEEGKNAEIYVSYGDGRAVKLDRASNTFNLEGLTVTVSGVFGGSYKTDADGNEIKDTEGNRIWEANTSESVTFSAKADVDAAVEKVKTFFEDFNALVTDINKEITTRPDSSYQPLTDEQKAQMDETSIENWEKKAKQGMLYGDSAMRDLSVAVQSIFSKMMSNGASYEDLKEIGITYSEDYGDGGTLVFDETAFRTAMENNPEKVSRIFTGGNGISKGLVNVVEETFTPYATRYANRNGGSYGRLVEIAGTNKKPTTLMDNDIYKQLKEMQETIDSLNERLQVEQDRYISQFTTMETLLNKMNTQSSYLSQLTA